MAAVLTAGVVVTIVYPFAVTATSAEGGHGSYIPILRAALVGLPGVPPTAGSIILAAAAAVFLGTSALAWAATVVAVARRRPTRWALPVATILTLAAFATGFILTNVWRQGVPWLPEALSPTAPAAALNFDILAFMFIAFGVGCAVEWMVALQRRGRLRHHPTWSTHLTFALAAQVPASAVSAYVGASLPAAGGPRSGRTGLGLIAAALPDGLAGVMGAATAALLLAVAAAGVWTMAATVRHGAAPGPALATALAAAVAQGAFFLFLWQAGRPAGASAYEPAAVFMIANLIGLLGLVFATLASRPTAGQRW
jgi:hypothetical protein